MSDLIIIGAGPGGYVCAIRAAQLGMAVTLVEERGGARPRLGGTCLNVGCIPSKALLDSSERFAEAAHLAEHGIQVESPRLDLAKLMARKERVVGQLTDGIAFLMKKNKVAVVAGRGELLGPGRVAVTAADGSRTELAARSVVLAMGSVPVALPSLPVDGATVVTSDHAIAFDRVPGHLIVVGAGVIGLELGSVWARLGAKVTVVEALPQICPFLDADVARELQKSLARQGLAFHLESAVSGVQVADGRAVLAATAKDGAAIRLEGDRVLVAVGRRPCSDGSGLAAAGVKLTERRRVAVDQRFQTSIPGVYAIGDLIEGPMLAHKAEEEGVAVAELLAGQKPQLDHHLIPSVVYTHPEVAAVGLTEAEAAKAGRPVKVGRFPFAANGRAKAAAATDGFVKLIADAASDRLLGGAVVGARASDLIGEIATTISYGGSSEDIARTCHAHPTFSEAVKEAALDVLGRAVHA